MNITPHIFPVIHHLNNQTTLAEADIAFDCGVTGIFLISHLGEDQDLLPLAATIKGKTCKYVGINMLYHSAYEALDYASVYLLDAMWTDNPGVTSTGMTQSGITLLTESQHRQLDVFASVAFKYQAVDPNPAQAAIYAKASGWIPTTSGPGTGKAPDVEKIKLMSEATEGWLAIASGMTPENVSLFTPYLSHILVSTGISKDEYHIDPAKLKAFVAAVNNV